MSSSLLFSAAHDDNFHELLPTNNKEARLSIAYLVAVGAIFILLLLLISILLLALIRSRKRKKANYDDVITENSHISAAESVGYDSIISSLP